MSSILPHQIPPEAFEAIAVLSASKEQEAVTAGGEVWAAYLSDIDKQNIFLDAFRKSFNVSRSLSAAGVNRGAYGRWRRSSMHFVENFNAAIAEWYETLYASAAARARGYAIEDDTTESGLAEDATGMVKYFDADTSLTKMFLKAMCPEQFGDKLKTELVGAGGKDLMESFAAAVSSIRDKKQ